jgi:hypothetical protein
MHDMENSSTPRCEMVRMYKMNFIGFLKVLIPSITRDSGYKYVFLSLDNVALTVKNGATFDIVKFFDIVESQRLHMASYAIEGGSYPGYWPQTPENSTQIGRSVSMIDIQAIIFDINAWQCFYELIDTEYPSCCGLDVWFWHRCINSRRIQEGKMGIIDTMKTVHNPFHLSTTNGADRDPMQLVLEQMHHCANERGIQLSLEVNVQTLGKVMANETMSDVLEN